jgi:hypothetical protein
MIKSKNKLKILPKLCFRKVKIDANLVTYKLDTEFYLLDENNLYITDLNNRRIQLSQ